MVVTSRLVMEDGNILPCGAVVVGPNRSFVEATKTLDGVNYGGRSQVGLALYVREAPVLLSDYLTTCGR
ncbi:MAG: hypothetical protein WAO95_17750 [Burkholderiales bacterium]